MYCRKPICDEHYDCGNQGVCKDGICYLGCQRDIECSQWASIGILYIRIDFY